MLRHPVHRFRPLHFAGVNISPLGSVLFSEAPAQSFYSGQESSRVVLGSFWNVPGVGMTHARGMIRMTTRVTQCALTPRHGQPSFVPWTPT